MRIKVDTQEMVSSISWQNEMTHSNHNANENQTDAEIDDKKPLSHVHARAKSIAYCATPYCVLVVAINEILIY